jgi:hypothetical protein
MTDLALRTAETRGTDAQLLACRLRAGLDPARVELAARLGHAGAREHYPDAVQVVWSLWSQRRDALVIAHAINHALLARLAADWAERILLACGVVHPWGDDTRSRDAINAARAWVGCPCEEHRIAAANAAVVAVVAYTDAADAALAYTDAALAYTDAAYAAYAAVAYTRAAYVAAVAAAYTDASYDASYAASYAAYAYATRDDERTWQRKHFAGVLLGDTE